MLRTLRRNVNLPRLVCACNLPCLRLIYSNKLQCIRATTKMKRSMWSTCASPHSLLLEAYATNLINLRTQFVRMLVRCVVFWSVYGHESFAFYLNCDFKCSCHNDLLWFPCNHSILLYAILNCTTHTLTRQTKSKANFQRATHCPCHMQANIIVLKILPTTYSHTLVLSSTQQGKEFAMKCNTALFC